MKIKELSDGFKGSITVLLTGVARGVTNKGAPYLSFTMQDDTGVIDAKYWNVHEDVLYSYAPGQVVEVSGDVITHQKQLQFRVNKAVIQDPVSVDINEYVPSGPVSQEELHHRIHAYLDSVQNKTIQTLLKGIMEDHEKDFFSYPAATKNHHDFVGGLATHVLGMLDLAEAVCKQYEMLNRDLLIGGVFLHDIGKLTELSGAVITEYTMEGKLLGHISIMQAEVDKKAAQLQLEGEEVILLRHMILSHHGVYEYGSPVLPMIPEAEILYLLDNMDARMNTMSKALSNIAEGEFTTRIFALENRSLYKKKMK